MRPARLLVIPAVLLLATACADDSSSSGNTATSTQASAAEVTAPTSEPYDPQPYCETTRRLEKAGENAFASLGRNATRAEYEAAERSFILDNVDLLDQLVAATPPDLTDDVETLLAAMRQRGELEDRGVNQREAARAEKKILAFEKRHC